MLNGLIKFPEEEIQVDVPVKTHEMDVVNIIAAALYNFLEKVIGPNDHIISLKGGAVLSLIDVAETFSAKAELFRLNDFDFHLGKSFSLVQKNKIKDTVLPIKLLCPDPTIRCDISSTSSIDLKLRDIIGFDGSEMAVVRLTVTLFGKQCDIDLVDCMSPSSIDFHCNTMEINLERNRKGVFKTSTTALASLFAALENRPQECLSLRSVQFCRDPSRVPVAAFHRIMKALEKGITVLGFNVLPVRHSDDSCGDHCFVCLEHPSDVPDDVLADPDSEISAVRYQMQRTIIQLRCDHHICVSCYLTMWAFYSDCSSHNNKCGMCRAPLKFRKEVLSSTMSCEKIETVLPWERFKIILPLEVVTKIPTCRPESYASTIHKILCMDHPGIFEHSRRSEYQGADLILFVD